MVFIIHFACNLDYLLGNALLGDLAKLVSGFFGGDSMNSESALDVIDKSEGFVGLLECDDVHETSWEGGIASDFTVNLDQIVISGLKHPQTNQHLSKIIWTKLNFLFIFCLQCL